ncbi:hypothetical protein JCM10207_005521 [Rhodosporidiobolus poonsookiae]
MASVGRLLKRDPSLTPLFAAVGCGVCGALAFGAHYLRHSSDVVIKKKENPEPWNKVQQGQNTKLMTRNPDFWASRQSTTDPRAVFASPIENTNSASPSPGGAAAAKASAVKKAKENTLAMFKKEGQQDSGEWKERSVEH